MPAGKLGHHLAHFTQDTQRRDVFVNVETVMLDDLAFQRIIAMVARGAARVFEGLVDFAAQLMRLRCGRAH